MKFVNKSKCLLIHLQLLYGLRIKEAARDYLVKLTSILWTSSPAVTHLIYGFWERLDFKVPSLRSLVSVDACFVPGRCLAVLGVTEGGLPEGGLCFFGSTLIGDELLATFADFVVRCGSLLSTGFLRSLSTAVQSTGSSPFGILFCSANNFGGTAGFWAVRLSTEKRESPPANETGEVIRVLTDALLGGGEVTRLADRSLGTGDNTVLTGTALGIVDNLPLTAALPPGGGEEITDLGAAPLWNQDIGGFPGGGDVSDLISASLGTGELIILTGVMSRSLSAGDVGRLVRSGRPLCSAPTDSESQSLS